MSIVLDQICQFLGELAPLSLAEEWDNVGLLVGRRSMTVERVMTCLTLSPDVAEEAADRGADLVVSHHPIPFRPVRRLTDDTVSGSVLLALMASNTAV
ncbi:MAG: Nif3-like dinuclear metal center hexameric protein, partial [Planctomycetota bacterium]